MEIRPAIKGQYRASLKMLRQTIEVCPEDVWVSGTHPRTFWRIAYHAVFYAHLYLMQNEAAFQPREKDRPGVTNLWGENPVVEPYSKSDLLTHLDSIDGMVDPMIDSLDLDTADSGFDWYPNFAKLDHVLLSIRHIQGHVGQLSELLFAHGIETDWVARVPRT